ncbi:hypothetical protein BDY21DRAFT_333202 [Lineolata rhizophorae]|uniref:Uncharacterized protein n=1 Tax=Lineolata rhizophorae TaxID=578093 RepID=A0A6A6PA86_9PEZI|nr:hypothetical protein BDY21DRAFT_333202 [Lineolata rhizophorae]
MPGPGAHQPRGWPDVINACFVIRPSAYPPFIHNVPRQSNSPTSRPINHPSTPPSTGASESCVAAE